MTTAATHLIKPGTPVTDMRLRCGLSIMDNDGICGSEASIDQIDCPGCLCDLIIEMRSNALRVAGRTPEARWLASGDTGTSSLTIWAVMTGWSMPDGRDPSIPHDPDDFGRCHRLLEAFPQWRGRLPEVAAKHPEWTGLVAAWDELTALYIEELPTGRAPRCYARMREVIEATERTS